MDRYLEFMETYQEENPNWLKIVYKQVMEEFQDQRETITADFFDVVKSALYLCNEAQAVGTKGPLRYILISPSHYGTCIGSYDVIISVFDERMYYDQTETMAYWNADFIYRRIETDMKDMKKIFSKKFIRIKAYEMEEFRRVYAGMHHRLLIEPIKLLAEDLYHSKLFKQVKCDNPVTVLMGKYMDKYVELYNFDMGDRL